MRAKATIGSNFHASKYCEGFISADMATESMLPESLKQHISQASDSKIKPVSP